MCVSLWGSLICMHLCSEREDNVLKHEPKSLETGLPWQLFVSTADHPIVWCTLALCIYVRTFTHMHICICCPITCSPERQNSCIEWKALAVWHLYVYYTRVKWLLLGHWKASMEWYITCRPCHSHYVPSVGEQWTMSFSSDYADFALSINMEHWIYIVAHYATIYQSFQEVVTVLPSYRDCSNLHTALLLW